MRKETYQIRRLPKNSIEETSEMCNGEQVFRRIVRNTFPEIHENLKIRPKAARFAESNEDVYVVFHKEEQKQTECLFLVKFVHSSFYDGVAQIQLCRCLGAHTIKRHYELVKYNLAGMSNFLEFHPEKNYDFTIS